MCGVRRKHAEKSRRQAAGSTGNGRVRTEQFEEVARDDEVGTWESLQKAAIYTNVQMLENFRHSPK